MVDIKAESALSGNVAMPFAPFLYTVSLLHCMPSGLGPCGHGAGMGMMWGREKALALLAEAGFEAPRVEEMDYDLFNALFVGEKQ